MNVQEVNAADALLSKIGMHDEMSISNNTFSAGIDSSTDGSSTTSSEESSSSDEDSSAPNPIWQIGSRSKKKIAHCCY